ncbi:potassium channel family protein [Cnuibacter sp. UC19_7]|uniref:potassium channel family protein n=1 Tax=Cnuibacter sp. UC19_7 TaxID=3350166 RepID=UPI003672BFAA
MTERSPDDQHAPHPPHESGWVRATRSLLLALSLAFIVAYSVQVLDPTLSDAERTALGVFIAATWAIFVVEYLVRFLIAPHKARFVRETPIELLAVVIPVFRPLLLLAYLHRIPALRGRSGSAVRGRVVSYAALFAVLFVYSISLGVLAAERGAPGSNIETFGDSLWWACVTIATVGYGDYYPVTALGRILAVMLMAGGIVIVGVATATIVSVLGERIRQAPRGRSRD